MIFSERDRDQSCSATDLPGSRREMEKGSGFRPFLSMAVHRRCRFATGGGDRLLCFLLNPVESRELPTRSLE